jgi:Tol biopolymer transport system component
LDYEPATVEADLSPTFSPDGRYLAFERHISPAVADIYVLELPQHRVQHAEARQLTNWNRLNINPVWTGDGLDILFVGNQPGLDSRIWRIPAFRPADARVIDQIGEGSSSIALCPRKNRLVYSRESSDSNIWRLTLDLTLAPSAPHHNPPPTQVIASTMGDSQPQYSAAGKFIAFRSYAAPWPGRPEAPWPRSIKWSARSNECQGQRRTGFTYFSVHRGRPSLRVPREWRRRRGRQGELRM